MLAVVVVVEGGGLQAGQESRRKATQDRGPAVGCWGEQTPASPPHHLDQEPKAPAAWGRGRGREKEVESNGLREEERKEEGEG